MVAGWVSAIAGAVAGAGATLAAVALTRKKEEPKVVVVHEATTLRPGSAGTDDDFGLAPFGLPLSATAVKKYKGFALGYDRRLRTSTFAYERMTKESIEGNAKRPSVFVEEKTEEEIFRIRNADYAKTGLDRGHLVPAADFKGSQIEMNETFVLSNICPQDPKLNRGYWSDLERFTRDLTGVFDEVHAVTGPLFLPEFDSVSGEWRANYRFVGQSPEDVLKSKVKMSEQLSNAEDTKIPLMPVPTHMYKVILGVKKDKAALLGAFVFPNAEIKAGTPLKNFLVPLPLLESLSGHKFFPKLTSQKDLCSEVACEISGRWKAANAKISSSQKE